ncbi:MAG: hypothetical protein NDJ75_03475 [Thermoanaerobaculia bacterium]|nr:hypothetical protein [Thermoanaerobaculia bacterium]
MTPLPSLSNSTHRRRFAGLLHLTLVALGLLGLARSAAGLEEEGLRLTFSDDLISGNAHPDDLYTAELRLESHAGGLRVRLGERMFTRREVGQRFDETYVDASLGVLERGGWRIVPRLGVLRVGKGLGGERAQNEIHDWVGSEPLALDYIPGRHWYPTFEAALERSWLVAGAEATAKLEGYAAPEFRQWLRGGVVLTQPIGEVWRVRAGVGYQFNRAEFDLLRGALRDSGPTAELGVAWRALELRWTYNDFGTRAGAVSLGLDFAALASGSGRRR